MTRLGHHVFIGGIAALATALVVLGSAVAAADYSGHLLPVCMTQPETARVGAFSAFAHQALTGEPGLSGLALATVIASAPAAVLLLTLAWPCSPPPRRR
jgi:hypothetical protein